MPNDIFISYSRRDEDFIKQLYQALIDQGISTWYDRENIRVGNQWATEIVEGIRDCKVFVLSLSPDSAASPNVRKEVDLAQRYDKQIVPLIWRTTEIPVAMEYQLAGIQWIEFNEKASEENFNQLIGVLQRLMGGSSMAEATTEAQIAKESSIPAVETETAAPTPSKKKLGGKRRLGKGLKKKQTVQPIATGAGVISSVVVTFGLDIEEQDFINGELKWLFGAINHLLKIQHGEADRTEPVPVEIPEDAERDESANNQLSSTVTEMDLPIFEAQISESLGHISTRLQNLNVLLDREARAGAAGRGNVELQNDIQAERLEIVKNLQRMARLMNEAYEILVTGPDQLAELLS